jgi:hypothetical protein
MSKTCAESPLYRLDWQGLGSLQRRDNARTYYAKFIALTENADRARPELQLAKAYLAQRQEEPEEVRLVPRGSAESSAGFAAAQTAPESTGFPDAANSTGGIACALTCSRKISGRA